MPLSLGQTNVTVSTNGIFIGEHPPIEQPGILIATNQVLVRGTCLAKKTADSKYYKWDTSKADGTQTLAGILVSDIDTTGADDYGSMYLHGEFNLNGLNAAQAIVAGWYNNSILILGDR